ncbi:MAG: FtsW/RodA/SpoVE family cell cycle protein, partial [Rhodospirillales bacterium]|nr:FtsW/RodA/SpoVE family cell cycle protein [Rhodospirillales bacterium]
MAQLDVSSNQGFRIAERLLRLEWFLVVLVCTIGAVGIGMLISASGGSTEPWAARQMVWFGAGLIVMLAVALVDIGFWLRAAYTIYGLAFALLVGVELMGAAGKGAQRWIDIGVIQLQPSELMKIAMVLALARYFHGVALDGLGRIRTYLPPLLMILAPAALILRQPDLGTALLVVLGGAIMLFLAGIKAWKIGVGVVLALGSGPVAWQFLHEYQKARILTFFNPEADPLGAGYHILQSKIALGSGGLFGKGYMQGTQSHLNFLPEKQTDFIFTMMA